MGLVPLFYILISVLSGMETAVDVTFKVIRTRGGWKPPHPGEEVYRFRGQTRCSVGQLRRREGVHEAIPNFFQDAVYYT